MHRRTIVQVCLQAAALFDFTDMALIALPPQYRRLARFSATTRCWYSFSATTLPSRPFQIQLLQFLFRRQLR